MAPHAVHPDPILHPPPTTQLSSKLSGCGPHGSYRHILHQRGTVGTFHVRLLEARDLKRGHWSALSLVPGLSSAKGQLSSFGSGRLAFWSADDHHDAGNGKLDEKKPSSLSTTQDSSVAVSKKDDMSSAQNFMPSMPVASAASSTSASAKQSPLTPFDQGCLASLSPARSPYFPAFAHKKTPVESNNDACKSSKDTCTLSNDLKNPPSMPPSSPLQQHSGPSPPHHYGKHQFRSSVIRNDSNPIWENEKGSNFQIPLRKEDLYPALSTDGCIVALEFRLDEEMAQAESLMVGGVLSHAVGAAAAATSLVPVVGKSVSDHAQKGATASMEMMGLGTDRLIGKGYVDLLPLLLGIWEEEFDKENHHLNVEEDKMVDDFGKINVHSHMRKRQVERMGVLDVWVPLFRESKDETHGKVHLVISYEPNGMMPKQHDVVALESFARRPYSDSGPMNIGSVITPILPPLYPLLVVETRGAHLLCEYSKARTVTSVDRNGNVKSSKWERIHRVRIHRNSAFVIERRTFLDVVGDVARMPGDMVFSTPVGREVAEASAPIVAAAGEVVAPMFIWGKLLMAAGGTGVKAGLAGLSAATSIATQAVVNGSQDKARSGRYESRGDEGVYRYG